MAFDPSSNEFVFLRRQLTRGNVVLFCGAGFSFDGSNHLGERPPLGNGLAALLAEQAGYPYDGEPLSVVFQAVRTTLGSSQLNRLLRDHYTIAGFKPWYHAVGRFIWHRAYTLNIDNLLEEIYRQPSANQRLVPIVCPAPPAERDVTFSELQCIHLHGHVLHPDKGLVFTLQEFAQQQVDDNPWYQELVDDLYYRPVIFLGTLAEESSLAHYVAMRGAKVRGTQEFRPKSFLVDPNIGPIRAASLQDQNIVPVEATAAEFFSALQGLVADDNLTLRSVRGSALPHLYEGGRRHGELTETFDPITPGSLPRPPISSSSFFFGAEPTWQDIEDGRDGDREATHELVEEVARHYDDCKCIVLHGSAGSGKTTIMKRAAYQLAGQGRLVYFARGDRIIKLRPLIRLLSKDDLADRVIVFIDVMSRHLGEIHRHASELQACSNLTLVLADRSNTYFTRAHALESFSPAELVVGNLVETEVESILAKLERFSFLGALLEKSHSERVGEFMVRASKQLLVAMKEATSGKGFDEILSDEFQELVPDAKLAYTICCLAVAQGAPGVYRKNLSPCLGKTSFAKGSIISELLRGVLVPVNESGTLLAPRHRVIASAVAREIAPVGLKVEAATELLRHLSREIVPAAIRRRSPAFLAYRGLINSEGLKGLFSQDYTVILGLYEELRDCYKDHFLFWLHFAMAHMETGALDVAENYLNQARTICERLGANSFQIRHQQGILYLTQAARSEPVGAGAERANEGIDLLDQMIVERGDVDSYPYGAYLTYVLRWYGVAGTLIKDSEWEGLRETARAACSRYPMDEILAENRQRVEKAYMLRAVKGIPNVDIAAGEPDL